MGLTSRRVDFTVENRGLISGNCRILIPSGVGREVSKSHNSDHRWSYLDDSDTIILKYIRSAGANHLSLPFLIRISIFVYHSKFAHVFAILFLRHYINIRPSSALLTSIRFVIKPPLLQIDVYIILILNSPQFPYALL